jgi:hypothetical protein
MCHVSETSGRGERGCEQSRTSDGMFTCPLSLISESLFENVGAFFSSYSFTLLYRLSAKTVNSQITDIVCACVRALTSLPFIPPGGRGIDRAQEIMENHKTGLQFEMVGRKEREHGSFQGTRR